MNWGRTLFLVCLSSTVSMPLFAQTGEREPRCDPSLPPKKSVDWLTHHEATERVKWFRRNFPEKIYEFYSNLFVSNAGTLEQALAQYDASMSTAVGRKLKYSAYPSFLYVEKTEIGFVATDPLKWTAPRSADASAYIPAGYRMMQICYAREEGLKPYFFFAEKRAAGLCGKALNGELTCLDDSRPFDPF